MPKPLILFGLLSAGAAFAQPLAMPRRIAPLPAMQRDARIASEFKVFAGKPLSGPFRVGPEGSIPAPVTSFEMDMVRTTMGDSGGGLALLMTTTLKTPVDILRPMIAIRLKPHAKPYLADCALSAGLEQQIAYYDAAEPSYHSKIMEKKSTAAVQNGHALFAVSPATTDHILYVAPITLDATKAYSLSFSYCEFSQVG